MKVTVLLKNDHEAVKSLFMKYSQGNLRPQNGKKELFEQIRRELMIHSQMETEIFYPALESTVSTHAGELISTARAEHQSVEGLLDEIAGMNSQDKQFDAKMSDLMDVVRRHIDTEEEEIFDEARKNLPEYRLEELGLEIEQRRKLLGQLAA